MRKIYLSLSCSQSLTFQKMIYFYFMGVNVLFWPACRHAHHTCVWRLRRSEEDVGLPGTGVVTVVSHSVGLGK